MEWNCVKSLKRGCFNFFATVIVIHVLVGLLWCFHYTTTFQSYRHIFIDASSTDSSALLNPALRNTSGISWMDSILTPLLTDKTRNESQILELFLKTYQKFCETRISASHRLDRNQHWCSCLPTNLVGRQHLKKILPSHIDMVSVESTHPEVTQGGHWRPIDCEPRQKIAIIIPYRGRQEQLHIFLHYMIPFLQRQLTEFKIFIVEQKEPEVFNKAALMNAGFLEVSKNQSFDCYFFHDVDTLPEDDRNFYTCTFHPHHLGWYVTRFNYRPYYWKFVGGGIAFTGEQLQRINGFSNKYYGWGGEDDDTYNRIIMSGMSVTRYPVAVARYTTIEHKRDPGNPINPIKAGLIAALKRDKTLAYMKKDGITTIKYSVRGIETKQLFTSILVDLPPPSKDYKFKVKTSVQLKETPAKLPETLPKTKEAMTKAPDTGIQTLETSTRTQVALTAAPEIATQALQVTSNQTQEAVTSTKDTP